MSFTAASLQQFLHQQIPLTAAMDLTVVRLGPSDIELAATLSANHNDKGTAFGGSLASLLTLCGWTLLLCRLAEAKVAADIMIHRQQLTYRQPVNEDFAGASRLPDEHWDEFVAALTKRRMARIDLNAWIGDHERPAATMQASYVAMMRTDDG